jgi:hypothetical protein
MMIRFSNGTFPILEMRFEKMKKTKPLGLKRRRKKRRLREEEITTRPMNLEMRLVLSNTVDGEILPSLDN